MVFVRTENDITQDYSTGFVCSDKGPIQSLQIFQGSKVVDGQWPMLLLSDGPRVCQYEKGVV